MSAAGPQAVGIDVGGTKTAALRVGLDGSVYASETLPTPADDVVATLDTVVDAARSVLAPEVTAVGIAAAGLVEAATGIMRFAPNLAWRDVALVDHVGTGIGLPTIADNDANAAAWGEFLFGAGRGHTEVLFVGVGTGIGGGIITGGKLFRGAHGFAAEIGHVIVEPGGPECGCGNRGCWEQVASGKAIAQDGRAAVARQPRSLLAGLAEEDPENVTGETVTEAARRGDPVSIGILTEVGRRLGEGIAGLVNILDPEIAILGGGASEAGELLLAHVRTAFRTAVEAPDHRPEVPIVAAELGNDAGAIGAALLALEETGA